MAFYNITISQRKTFWLVEVKKTKQEHNFNNSLMNLIEDMVNKYEAADRQNDSEGWKSKIDVDEFVGEHTFFKFSELLSFIKLLGSENNFI